MHIREESTANKVSPLQMNWIHSTLLCRRNQVKEEEGEISYNDFALSTFGSADEIFVPFLHDHDLHTQNSFIRKRELKRSSNSNVFGFDIHRMVSPVFFFSLIFSEIIHK